MITFDANGGDSAPVATTGTVGSIKISSDAPKYGGRKFLGWSLARDGAVAYRQGDAYAGNTDILLYAVWEITPITVSFDANGGSNAPAAVSGQPGAIRIPEAIPTRNGYSFVGWSTKKNSSSAEYMPDDIYADESNAILYAVWNEKSVVKVILHANDGTDGAYTMDVTPGSRITIAYRPAARDGYSLLGWSESEGSDAIDYECDQTVEISDKGLTLYAVWATSEKVVYFNENGGTGGEETITTADPVIILPDDLDCICSLDAESAECKGSGLKSLPKTGPGEIAIMIVAITSVVTGGLYWFRSQKELQDIQKKY
jgi:uncharacterized repeat protein (TIGR02543 family)